MKFKTTRKDILNNYSHIIRIPYCDAQFLLEYHDPIAYNCGVYGWNFDVYAVEGVAICTGYRSLVGETFKNLKKYEEKARKIYNNWDLTYQQKQKRLNRLLHNMIVEFKEG